LLVVGLNATISSRGGGVKKKKERKADDPKEDDRDDDEENLPPLLEGQGRSLFERYHLVVLSLWRINSLFPRSKKTKERREGQIFLPFFFLIFF
jgi:hypothetical protein